MRNRHPRYPAALCLAIGLALASIAPLASAKTASPFALGCKAQSERSCPSDVSEPIVLVGKQR